MQNTSTPLPPTARLPAPAPAARAPQSSTTHTANKTHPSGETPTPTHLDTHRQRHLLQDPSSRFEISRDRLPRGGVNQPPDVLLGHLSRPTTPSHAPANASANAGGNPVHPAPASPAAEAATDVTVREAFDHHFAKTEAAAGGKLVADRVENLDGQVLFSASCWAGVGWGGVGGSG